MKQHLRPTAAANGCWHLYACMTRGLRGGPQHAMAIGAGSTRMGTAFATPELLCPSPA